MPCPIEEVPVPGEAEAISTFEFCSDLSARIVMVYEIDDPANAVRYEYRRWWAPGPSVNRSFPWRTLHQQPHTTDAGTGDAAAAGAAMAVASVPPCRSSAAAQPLRPATVLWPRFFPAAISLANANRDLVQPPCKTGSIREIYPRKAVSPAVI